jgi:hypothetical protein
MRPLSTDRPDATESPYTVDAGHFQVEADLAAYLRDAAREDGTNVRGWGFAITNVKAGLTNRVDLQLIFETYRRETTTAPGAESTAEGFGDLTLRGKLNLLGNDGGETAFALLPFVKFPTAANGLGNGDLEGGVALPLAVELPWELGLGTQLEIEALRDDADEGYDLGLGATLAVGRDIRGSLGGFVEVAARWQAGDFTGTFNAGLTLGIGEDLQLDAAAYLGLNRAAEDLVVFVGISWRY